MRGKATLGSTTTEIPGCSFSRCMVLFGGTSRRSAPSGTRRGVGCGERSSCFQLLALFTLGFWTLLLRRLLLKEFPVPCARAVRAWNLVHYFRVLVSGSHCSGCLGVAFEYENWILRETTFFVGAMLGTTADTCSASVLWWLWKNVHIFYVVADSFPEALLLRSV